MNCKYFVTPYRNVSSGSKDDFNFYHSQVSVYDCDWRCIWKTELTPGFILLPQLRIRIECACGQLVARWGILRRAIPSQFRIRKTTSLTIALCRLHNFCINMRLAENFDEQEQIPCNLACDTLEIVAHGGIPLVRTRENDSRPEQLLDFGNHNDDTSLEYRRQFVRRGLGRNDVMPRERRHDMVIQGGFKRPTPNETIVTQI
jgi:hypothetical protein